MHYFVRHPFIGILDISGFENVKVNSLEQLFINITNERLHQYLQHQIFGLENLDYANEGIEMQPNTFHDNQPVLNLICEVIHINNDVTIISLNSLTLLNRYFIICNII